MMRSKKLFVLTLAMAMCIPMGFNALAAQNSTEQTPPAASIEEFLGSDVDGTLDEQAEPRVAAPALSAVYVYSVESEQARREYIASTQYMTTLDHGGDWIKVVTLDVGYSGSRRATIDGNIMTLTNVTPVDTDGDSILDGYLREWTLKSYIDSGKFIYRASPQYSGRNYEAWINVK